MPGVPQPHPRPRVHATLTAPVAPRLAPRLPHDWMPGSRERIRGTPRILSHPDESKGSMVARPNPAPSTPGMPSATVTVYTLPFCGACARARALLARRAIAYDEVSGAGVADFRGQLAARTGGATVPQIVIRGVALGGADDLARLDRLGLLLPLVAGIPSRSWRTASGARCAHWDGGSPGPSAATAIAPRRSWSARRLTPTARSKSDASGRKRRRIRAQVIARTSKRPGTASAKEAAPSDVGPS